MSVGVGAWLVSLVLSILEWYCSLRGASRVAVRMSALAAVYLHPTVAQRSLRLLHCEAVQLSQVAITALDGGGGGGHSSVASQQGSTLSPVNLLVSDSFIVCFRGDHLVAGSVAAIALAAYVVGLPVTTFWWLWRDSHRRRTAAGIDMATTSAAARDIPPPHSPATPQLDRTPPLPSSDEPILAPFVADSGYAPHGWFWRHVDMLIVLGLNALAALLPLPASLPLLAAKLSATFALLCVLMMCLLMLPNPYKEPWRWYLRVALVALSASCVVVNGATRSLDLGFGGPALEAFITPASYLNFVILCVTFTVLLVGFGHNILTRAMQLPQESQPTVVIAPQPTPAAKDSRIAVFLGEPVCLTDIAGLAADPDASCCDFRDLDAHVADEEDFAQLEQDEREHGQGSQCRVEASSKDQALMTHDETATGRREPSRSGAPLPLNHAASAVTASFPLQAVPLSTDGGVLVDAVLSVPLHTQFSTASAPHHAGLGPTDLAAAKSQPSSSAGAPERRRWSFVDGKVPLQGGDILRFNQGQLPSPHGGHVALHAASAATISRLSSHPHVVAEASYLAPDDAVLSSPRSQASSFSGIPHGLGSLGRCAAAPVEGRARLSLDTRSPVLTPPRHMAGSSVPHYRRLRGRRGSTGAILSSLLQSPPHPLQPPASAGIGIVRRRSWVASAAAAEVLAPTAAGAGAPRAGRQASVLAVAPRVFPLMPAQEAPDLPCNVLRPIAPRAVAPAAPTPPLERWAHHRAATGSAGSPEAGAVLPPMRRRSSHAFPVI